MNGEIPPNLNPAVFWITIGTNDFLKTQCSEEVVLLGILRIVEEIQYQKPSSIIVINSILPISTRSNGVLDDRGPFRKVKTTVVHDSNIWWPAIVSVNNELEKFASEQHNVKYFDANKVFVEERSDGTYIVEGTMMRANVHPSKEGHKAWGKAITERLDIILNKKHEI
uniref:SGNH hydrolase-type esterase domain-containing protein n=2 Tax=Ditylum brightwellii TaxID=49249 RepID=A0A7S4RMZ3_9STRA